jgi:hypothetical protein
VSKILVLAALACCIHCCCKLAEQQPTSLLAVFEAALVLPQHESAAGLLLLGL